MSLHEEKHTYHFEITEMVDGEKRQVMNFDCCCNHDLEQLACMVRDKECIDEKHARQFVVGLKLLQNALKNHADKPEFAALLRQLDEFKAKMKNGECKCNCD